MTTANTPALIDMILTQLQVPEERRLQSVIDKLIEDNDANLGKVTQVLSYKGEEHFHSNIATRPTKKVPMNVPLHMTAPVEAFLAERDKLKSDMAQIKDLLRNMIGSTKIAQEIRNRIPDCLVQYAPGWVATTPRTEDLQHAHRYDRTLWKRYTMLAGKIDMYAATGLLY